MYEVQTGNQIMVDETPSSTQVGDSSDSGGSNAKKQMIHPRSVAL